MMRYTIIESATGDELGIIERDSADDLLEHLVRAGFLEGAVEEYALREDDDEGIVVEGDDGPELLLQLEDTDLEDDREIDDHDEDDEDDDYDDEDYDDEDYEDD